MTAFFPNNFQVGMGYDSAVSKVTGIGFISGTCPE
jgi:hypothetical protein